MRPEDLTKTAAGAAWHRFLELSAIPRPSGHEAAARAWAAALAAGHGWATVADAAGNLVIRVPGRGRWRRTPPLILQGHLDLVPEKRRESPHDFLRDPIRPAINGDWIAAGDTTLGADNGVAIAIALAVAEADLPDRLPLELLFTVEEETGLNGAARLDASLLAGRRLLNLDGDQDGVFVIGCAGGVDLAATFALTAGRGDGAGTCVVRVEGLRGGHSGVDIHENRGHAIQIAGEILAALKRRCPGLRLHSVAGGNKKNAIPREVEFVVSGCLVDDVHHVAGPVIAALKDREPGISLTVATGLRAGRELSAGVMDFLAAVPNGVVAMEPNYPDLVQTSNSVGVAAMGDDGLQLLAHGRSSSVTALAALEARIKALGARCGGRVQSQGGYPGWAPNPKSKLLAHAAGVYRRRFGHEPLVRGIHAGLEAGIIGAKLGTDELLSCGATLENAHAPGERLAITSFNRLHDFVRDLVTSEWPK